MHAMMPGQGRCGGGRDRKLPQRHLRPVHHGQRDDPVECDHGPGREGGQVVVKDQDLRPVRISGAASLVVHRRDRGLELVGPDGRAGQGAGNQFGAFPDHPPVPPAAVLFGERDKLPAGSRPRWPAGLGEQHEREQPGGLAVVWPPGMQLTGQPDRLGGQFGSVQRRPRTRGVPLVEDQVQHPVHADDPIGQLGRPGQLEFRGGQLLLGPAYPLAHGGLRHQEPACDLRGGKPADGAQRQGDLRQYGEQGVAAQQHQDKRVVLRGSWHRRRRFQLGRRPLPPRPRRVAPPQLDTPPGRRRDQPAGRVVRHTGGRPLHGRREQRFLHGILAGREVSVAADQDAEDLRRQLAQQAVEITGKRHRSSAGAAGMS